VVVELPAISGDSAVPRVWANDLLRKNPATVSMSYPSVEGAWVASRDRTTTALLVVSGRNLTLRAVSIEKSLISKEFPDPSLAGQSPLCPPPMAADGRRLENLERRGLVSRTDGRRVTVGLAHPVYGDVLRARVSALRHRSIARSLAEAVEVVGARRREDALRVATWQLIGGGAEPSLMLEAALTARWRYDFPLAERLANAAIEAGAGFEAELLAAQLMGLQGRSSEARSALALLAESAVSDEEKGLVALTRLDNRVIYDGTIDEGLRIAEQSVTALEGTSMADEIAARRCALLVSRDGPSAAIEVAEPLLRSATGRALVWSCMPGSYSLARAGRISEALTAASRGLEAQRALIAPMDWYPWMHHFYEGEALAHAGRFKEADDLALRHYQAGLADRSLEAEAMFSWQLAKTVSDRGDVDEAVRRAQMAIAIYRRLDRPQFVQFCLAYLALALSIGQRHAEAAEALQSLDQLGIEPGYFMGVDIIQARGWCEVANGNLRQARSLFREAAEQGDKSGDRVGLAAALHNLARIGHARDVVSWLDTVASEIEGDLALSRAAHTRALHDAAPDALEAVSERFEAMGATLLAAEARADAAVPWRRRGEPRSAAAAGRKAAWIAERCKGANTPALHSLETRASLTSAEVEAAGLAAAGRSNKEIAEVLCVSVRTIENRLQHIYGKLGVAGRSGLSDALRTIRGSAS
jgi:DNA-binding NarL/FixJ family response regulator